MHSFDFDLAVIGAGSGGIRAAKAASRHGARVALIERDRVGGTCVIRGCVPKKLLVLAGRFADEIRMAAGYGWDIAPPRHNWSSLIAAKNREIDRLESLYLRGLEESGVTLLPGVATLRDAHSISVSTQPFPVSARHILISTGASASIDKSIPGHEYAITSSEMLDLDELPPRLAIVGGGYIAVEFAGLMQALGSKVTLIHRGEHLLRGFDEELRILLGRAYQRRGIDLKLMTKVVRMDLKGKGKVVQLSDGTREEFDVVMFATGRHPDIHALGLEHLGITLSRGAIAVDAHSMTNVPSVYAIGDVTNRANLTPVAIREAELMVRRLFENGSGVIDYGKIPTAVFSTPEIGTVGMSEAVARASGRRLTLFRSSFRPLKECFSLDGDKTFLKLVVDSETDQVLGVHVMGEGAAEIIQMAAVALTCGATKRQFDETIAVHPSIAEELVTMRQPAQ